MRFKSDENLHPDVTKLLRDNGHDALSVWDEGLRGKPDNSLAELCRFEARSLLTLDVGFSDIRAYPPQQFPGIIVLRLNHQDRRHVMSVLPRILELLKTEPLAGRLWVVDEYSVRVRGGEEV